MSAKQNQALEIQLKVPKESYSGGEPIDVTLTLRNLSSAPLTVNKRMGINPKRMAEGTWEVKFDVIFPPGEPPFMISTRINRGQPHRGDFALLPPGGEVTEEYTLTDFYAMELPGTYEIKAIYHNSVDGREFGLSAWTGEVTSNTVSLMVTG
jgi:hypothetical protein